MNMRYRVALLGLLVGLNLSYPGTGETAWTLYDSFDSSAIDPLRWGGSVSTGDRARPTTETGRFIRFGKVVLSMTQWARDDTDSGSASGTNRLGITHPSAIMGMKAEISVTRAVAQACANNPDVARARARTLASFFNDGSSLGPGDLTGDIAANIELLLDSSEGNVIWAVRFRCADSSCVTGNDVEITTFRTRWEFNKPLTASFFWDPDNDKFVYTVKPLIGPEETIEIPYAYDDARPPGGKFSQIQARLNPPNCNGDRKHALMEYTIDDVMTLLPDP